MTPEQLRHRASLPIAARPWSGTITYSAKDPETRFAAIEQLLARGFHGGAPVSQAHLLAPREGFRIAMARQ